MSRSGMRAKEVDHIWVSLYSPQVGEESAERLTADDRQRIARGVAAITQGLSEAAAAGRGSASVCESTEEPGGLPVLQDVDELFGRLADACGAVCFRRHSGLQPVRMQHQQRAALDSGRQDCGTVEGWAYGAKLAGGGVGSEKVARRWRGAGSVAGHSFCGRAGFAGSNYSTGRGRGRMSCRQSAEVLRFAQDDKLKISVLI